MRGAFDRWVAQQRHVGEHIVEVRQQPALVEPQRKGEEALELPSESIYRAPVLKHRAPEPWQMRRPAVRTVEIARGEDRIVGRHFAMELEALVAIGLGGAGVVAERGEGDVAAIVAGTHAQRALGVVGEPEQLGRGLLHRRDDAVTDPVADDVEEADVAAGAPERRRHRRPRLSPAGVKAGNVNHRDGHHRYLAGGTVLAVRPDFANREDMSRIGPGQPASLPASSIAARRVAGCRRQSALCLAGFIDRRWRTCPFVLALGRFVRHLGPGGHRLRLSVHDVRLSGNENHLRERERDGEDIDPFSHMEWGGR